MDKISAPKIVILGSMCRLPVAGVVLQILHYMIGYKKLGFDPFYVEWHGNWIQNPTESSNNISNPRVPIGEVMRVYGFGDKWICRGDQIAPGFTFGGMSTNRLSSIYKEAIAIVNVTGAHFMEDEQLQCPRRVYVESDPGIPQIKLGNGDPKMWSLINGHTHYFTFGENINNKDCLLPSQNISYLPTRQPIVLDLWDKKHDFESQGFTTIARWKKHKEKSILYKGETYRWNKDVEFEKFLELPQKCNQRFELALSEISTNEKLRLMAKGWHIIDAIPLSASINEYREYIHRSRGEFTIAKDQYVRLRTGWFSDRSACYLAAGRPVITQDTGFGKILPTGEGLFAFQTVEDILAAFDAIDSDYNKHCQAAREIAREYFDSDKVLTQILGKIGVG